jgi:adenylosuccinate synthase
MPRARKCARSATSSAPRTLRALRQGCSTASHKCFLRSTGRPRRCGWLDVPVIHYSHALNNYQSINITKLDVLSDFDEIKIGALVCCPD